MPKRTDPSAAPEAANEVLAGSVERVTFHNPGNGFCVLRIKASGLYTRLRELLSG